MRRLLIIRGPSGAGKSTVAAIVRERMGAGTALISQDYFRRVVVGEHDRPGSTTPHLVARTVQTLLDEGFDVVLEGMLRPVVYAETLAELDNLDSVETRVVRLDIDRATALARHRARSWSVQVDDTEFHAWFNDYSGAALPGEHIIDGRANIGDIVTEVLTLVGERGDGIPPMARVVSSDRL